MLLSLQNLTSPRQTYNHNVKFVVSTEILREIFLLSFSLTLARRLPLPRPNFFSVSRGLRSVAISLLDLWLDVLI